MGAKSQNTFSYLLVDGWSQVLLGLAVVRSVSSQLPGGVTFFLVTLTACERLENRM